MVLQIDLAECSEYSGADFEDRCGDGVADDEMALVVEGPRESLVVYEGVAGFETSWGWGNDGVEIGKEFMATGRLLALFDLLLDIQRGGTDEMTP